MADDYFIPQDARVVLGSCLHSSEAGRGPSLPVRGPLTYLPTACCATACRSWLHLEYCRGWIPAPRTTRPAPLTSPPGSHSRNRRPPLPHIAPSTPAPARDHPSPARPAPNRL